MQYSSSTTSGICRRRAERCQRLSCWTSSLPLLIMLLPPILRLLVILSTNHICVLVLLLLLLLLLTVVRVVVPCWVGHLINNCPAIVISGAPLVAESGD